jgi:hypothetical protein
VVSVQYATIVPMTDADIAGDNVSRDASEALCIRNTVHRERSKGPCTW